MGKSEQFGLAYTATSMGKVEQPKFLADQLKLVGRRPKLSHGAITGLSMAKRDAARSWVSSDASSISIRDATENLRNRTAMAYILCHLCGYFFFILTCISYLYCFYFSHDIFCYSYQSIS